jgi:hypothetical protein
MLHMQAITDMPTLVAEYQAVIDMYKLRWVDFDIEGGAVAELASVERRNRAIKILQVRGWWGLGAGPSLRPCAVCGPGKLGMCMLM